MSNSLKWRVALLLAVALLGGCGPSYTYRYSPPPSVMGMNCINSCASERNHCKQMARLQENSEQALYQANLRSYQYCQAGKSKKTHAKVATTPATRTAVARASVVATTTTAATSLRRHHPAHSQQRLKPSENGIHCEHTQLTCLAHLHPDPGRLQQLKLHAGRWLGHAEDAGLGDNGLPAQPYMHCNKRGCHDHKPMLFDPSKAEPDATTLHRGW